MIVKPPPKEAKEGDLLILRGLYRAGVLVRVLRVSDARFYVELLRGEQYSTRALQGGYQGKPHYVDRRSNYILAIGVTEEQFNEYEDEVARYNAVQRATMDQLAAEHRAEVAAIFGDALA